MMISKKTDELILAHVARDLAPAAATVHVKAALAAVVGGFLSLMVCGQFGIGWTSFAESFSAKIHATMNPMACAVVCGILFAIFPTALLRLMSPPMQFRTMVRKKFGFLAMWFGGFGAALAHFGHHGNDAPEFAAWALAVLAAVIILSKAFDKLLPTFDLRLAGSDLLKS